jgi:N-acetylmuramoyl-L-alanine amidase
MTRPGQIILLLQVLLWLSPTAAARSDPPASGAAQPPAASGAGVPKGGPVERPAPAQRKIKVVLDPGHGGSQKGAVGVGGFTEKDFTLKMARALALRLSADHKLQIIFTREGDEDVSLEKRVTLANEAGADIFISIHANSISRPNIGGVETFFHSLEASGEEARRVAGYENSSGSGAADSGELLQFILADIQQTERLNSSAQLASLLHRRLVKALPWEDRGIMQADFIVLRNTRMPSVLLELGFVTNRRDVKLLRQNESLEKLALAIADGLEEFCQLLRRKQGLGEKGQP